MINKILEERGSRYGDFEDNATMAQGLKETMRLSETWLLKPAVVQEALDNIQQKIARIINGDHLWIDSVTDIIGYATLMKDSMENLNGCSQNDEEDLST